MTDINAGVPQIAQIEVAGVRYNAWQAVTVVRELNVPTSQFSFVAAEGDYGLNYDGLKVRAGDPCKIYLAGQLALTGYIEEKTVNCDIESHVCTVTGLSNTRNAIETSVPITKGTYNGYSFEQYVKSLLNPLNIGLEIKNDDGDAQKKFDNLIPHYGETIAESVSRVAAARALYLTDNANGDLVAHRLGDGGSGGQTFQQGVNILRMSHSEKVQGMNNSYQAVSQTPGTDQTWPTRDMSASVSQGGLIDFLGKTKNLFLAEMPLNKEALKLRAQHENAVSAWTAFTVTVTVYGWLDPNGSLWDPVNSGQMSVYAPALFDDPPYKVDNLAIQSVTFQQDENGSTTTIVMTLASLLKTAAGGDGGGSSGGDPSQNADNKQAQVDPPDDQSQASANQTATQDGQADGFGSTNAVQSQQPAFPTDAQTDEAASTTAENQKHPVDTDGDSFDVDQSTTTPTTAATPTPAAPITTPTQSTPTSDSVDSPLSVGP